MSAEELREQSVAVVLGTRPEIIKLAPVVAELGTAALVVHTGQHYDRELSQIFIDQFGVQRPSLQLRVGGRSRGQQIGRTVTALDERFGQGDLDAVIVQGDTNTTMAGAIAANANGLPLFHVEAGLRSFDRVMPEEHNRVVTDHLATRCFAPTETNVTNLSNEGIDDERVRQTGNTIVEALRALVPDEVESQRIPKDVGLSPGGYVLATLHRPENVDDPDPLARCLKALQSVSLPVYFPIHPRTRERIEALNLGHLTAGIDLVDPVDYRTFLALERHARLIISDSGGVQEEVTILKRPLVVVRNSTERPESLGTFATLVRPHEDLEGAVQRRLEETEEMLDSLAEVPSPYGDGTAARRIVEEVCAALLMINAV